MPIGTVDYVSTAAWNDTTNPWPQYSRLMLSAIDTELGSGVPFAYELTYFVPATQINAVAWIYTSIDDTYDGAQAVLTLFKNNVSDASYTAELSWDGGDPEYRLSDTTRKGMPAGYVQGNNAWVADNGDDAASLSIVPVTTYLTPWEYRRRRALEMI